MTELTPREKCIARSEEADKLAREKLSGKKEGDDEVEKVDEGEDNTPVVNAEEVDKGEQIA